MFIDGIFSMRFYIQSPLESSRKVRKIQASKPCGWNHTQIKIWLSENMVPLNPMVNDHFPHKQWPFRRVFSPCIQDPYENWTSTKPWDLSPILTIKGEDFQRFFSWQNRQFHGQLPSLFVVKPIAATYHLGMAFAIDGNIDIKDGL